MDFIEIVLIVVAAFILLSLARKVVIAKHATPIDPNSADWLEATRKVQASLSTARSLFEETPGSVIVKYAVTNSQGDREHVWGELLEITDESFTATMENSLVEGNPENDPPYTLSHELLEDWAVINPNGTVRGGFTIEAEIALARAEGKSPAGQAAEFEGKFIDA